jgi:cytidylate kinase
MRKISIAIDGHAASGKSTTAKLLARKLGFLPIDTGAMYRAITLKVLRLGIPIGDERKITEIAENSAIEQRLINENVHTFLDGEDVSEEIRKPEVDRFVSIISAYPGVRRRLVEIQREMAKEGGVILEGRDIGTVVLPDADIKIFMTASLEERARRRLKELEERGIYSDFDSIKRELEKRDHIDSTRTDSPLKIAEDAIIVDTTNLSIEEQVDIILKEIERKVNGV